MFLHIKNQILHLIIIKVTMVTFKKIFPTYIYFMNMLIDKITKDIYSFVLYFQYGIKVIFLFYVTVTMVVVSLATKFMVHCIYFKSIYEIKRKSVFMYSTNSFKFHCNIKIFFQMMTFLTSLHLKNNQTAPGEICICYCQNSPLLLLCNCLII